MWKKIFAVIFVLSLAMNIGFGVTWGLRRFSGEPPADAGGASQPEIWSPLHRELGVTEKQWEKIEPLVKSFQNETQKQAQRMQELRSQMLDLLSAEEVDHQAIEQQQEKVLDGLRGMQDIVLGHLIEEKQILTARQEEELFEMLRQRSGCPVAGGPPMMGDQGEGAGMGRVLRKMEKRGTNK